MERKVYNIGKLSYLITIFFGKHRQIVKETIEIKSENDKETQSESNPCDFIITMGKKAVIMTEANPNNPNLRLPFVVKRWKHAGNEEEKLYNRKMKFYVDNDGYNWIYTKDNVGELISYFKDDTKLIHFEVQSK